MSVATCVAEEMGKGKRIQEGEKKLGEEEEGVKEEKRKISRVVNCMSLTEVEPTTKAKLKNLHQQIFNQEMLDGELEIIFWIQEGTEIISMAGLHKQSEVSDLQQGFFPEIEAIGTDTKVNVVFLHSVGTAEKYRRQGCIKMVLQKIIDYVTNNHQDNLLPIVVFLEVEQKNKIAIDLYTTFGFRIIMNTNEDSNYLMGYSQRCAPKDRSGKDILFSS